MVEHRMPPRSAASSGCTTLTFERIVVDERKILRIQGYRNLEIVRPVIRRAAYSAARETEKLINPTAYYRNLSVRICRGGVLELQDGTLFRNDAFERLLDRVERITVFVLTMGHDLDAAVIAAIAEDQLLHALFLETAGWLGIEAATKQLAIHLRDRARRDGYRLSSRLGPGYSYKLDGRSVLWPLVQQRQLFGLLSEAPMNVQLLESCAMLPKISRSGLFGLLPVPAPEA